MNRRIVCYRLEAKPGPRSLTLPEGSEPLAATYHQGAIGLWVNAPEGQVDKMVPRVFELIETGVPFSGPLHYLGTCVAPAGTFCLHVLERIDEEISGELLDALRQLDISRVLVALRTDLQAADAARAALARRVESGEDDAEEALAEIRSRLDRLEEPS